MAAHGSPLNIQTTRGNQHDQEAESEGNGGEGVARHPHTGKGIGGEDEG